MIQSLRSRRVVLPEGVAAATIEIRDGRIAAITSHDEGRADLDVGDLVVLPGLVDTHVHLNDPGRADWEGFESGTRAAAAGGVTTIVDMPLNSIPATTTVDGLQAKRAAARGHCHVDAGFWGGVVPGNAAQLEPLARAGVLGFKCFLSPSGVDEFDHVTEDDLREALPVIARVGLPLLVHAELPAQLIDPDPQADPRQYGTWLASRPPGAEQAAVEMLVRLAGEFGARIHIVHLATSDAVGTIVEARRAGVPITVETCPHYLCFAAEQIGAGATAYKCAPPIREQRHRDGLWQALSGGHIDLIASDHSPAPPGLKRLDDGDFVAAWGGIASLQVGLPAVWTQASARGLAIDCLARWMAQAPARLAGLDARKGSLAVGRDADFVIFDPEALVVVDPEHLHHRHRVTPYAGLQLRGRVHQTILRGAIVYDNGTLGCPPRGMWLSSATAAPQRRQE